MPKYQADESIAYHAARLLLLISYCGKPQRSASPPAIEGRTLLAKLDFFLRYPSYLIKASSIENQNFSFEAYGIDTPHKPLSVESRMVRFRYGPWDHIYYPALAYLVGKSLITIDSKRGTDVFRITNKGKEVAKQLSEDPSYADLVSRARTVYKLFNRYSGNRLKEFIYNHFPEVVNRKLGERI